MRTLSHRSRLLAAGLAGLLTGTLGLATPAAQGAPAGPRAQIVGQRNQPYGTLAWTGKVAVITESGTNGDLYYWWNSGGDTSWHREVVDKASNGIQFSDPALAWTGTYDTSNPAVVITATGSNGDLYYWWQKAGTTLWHKQLVAAGDYANPSVAATSTSVVIAATSLKTSNLYYWYQTFQTTPWHQQVVSHSQFLSASIGWTGSNVAIAAVNAAPREQVGNIDYWWNPGGNTSWHQQTVAAATGTTSYSTPSLAVTTHAVIIAATDQGFNVYYWYQWLGTSTWHRQKVAHSSVGFSNPSVAWADNTTFITVPGVVGGLNVYYQPYGTTPWTGQTVASAGEFYFQGGSITGTGGATVIAAIENPSGNPGNVEYFSQMFGTTPWHEQTVASKCC